MDKMLRHIMWTISETCNYKCLYCNAWHRKNDSVMYQSEEIRNRVINRLNELHPEILDITGGEPLIVPDFLDILNRIDGDIKLMITTNLSRSMVNFTKYISPERIIGITASYHPGMADKEVFASKCLFLMNRGYNINVNMVAFPEHLWMIRDTRDWFTSKGILFHVDDYKEIVALHDPAPIGESFVKYTPSAPEYDILKEVVGEDRQDYITPRPVKLVRCSAGVHRLTLMPDSSLFRCVLDMRQNIPPIGKLLDEEIEFPDNYVECTRYNECIPCDRDYNEIEILEE